MKSRNRIRVLRAEKRITQLDAAAKARISVSRLWRIENGYAEATEKERERLAKLFKVQPSDIFPEAVAS